MTQFTCGVCGIPIADRVQFAWYGKPGIAYHASNHDEFGNTCEKYHKEEQAENKMVETDEEYLNRLMVSVHEEEN